MKTKPIQKHLFKCKRMKRASECAVSVCTVYMHLMLSKCNIQLNGRADNKINIHYQCINRVENLGIGRRTFDGWLASAAAAEHAVQWYCTHTDRHTNQVFLSDNSDSSHASLSTRFCHPYFFEFHMHSFYSKRNRKSSKIESSCGKNERTNETYTSIQSSEAKMEKNLSHKKYNMGDPDEKKGTSNECVCNDIPWRLHRIHTYFTAKARKKQIKWQSLHKFLLFCV